MSSASRASPVYSWSDGLEVVEQRSFLKDAFERFRRNRMAVASLVFVLFVLLASIVGPMISPYDYTQQNLLDVAKPPSAAHWFGTDTLGRDYLTRILMGGRTAFFIAVFVVGVTTVLGVVVGACSAYYGGWVDNVMMRITDVIMSFPQLLFTIFIVGTVRNPVVDWLSQYPFLRDNALIDYLIVFGALSIVEWPGKARLIRGQVLSLMRKEFVEAERAIGAPGFLIIRDHLVPNAIGPVIVAISAQFGGVMISEAALSFLGIGIKPPGASWGNMISENLVTWRYQPHLLAMPGIVLALVVLGCNFLGDGVNDALNPRLRQR